ncbi:GAF domain-containing protein [Agromyces aurantiacus]|uniref:GAF domain-containing protein n=1 Tax=Agromyces aurantiacus TaxID=165814 RepID=A0ABV9R4X8_9MICO|nr:GAF domain-containing protein [Agromyces aurantiacus]MBM7503330.1 signal transduction histidine kinase [Agromyces aurantiacus]
MRTQGRLRALLGATQAVVEQIELSEVLRRIVEAAVELVDAQYGALGVLAPQGGLEEFIHVGMPDDAVHRIGHLPEGHGLLGALIDHPDPIRLERIADDSRSVGFPEGHPPMSSFLGVPVRVRDEVFGNLYLTNRRHGEFSDEDIELTSALAAAAGVAIDNARRFTEARMREAWAAASAQVVSTLLTTSDTEGTAALMADELAVRGAADRIAVLVPDEEDPHTLRVREARGLDADRIAGAAVPFDRTLAAVVLEGGDTRATPGGRTDGLADALALEDSGHFGPVLFTAIRRAGVPRAVIAAGRRPGMPHFTPAEMRIAEDFAERASLAHELAGAREAQQRSVLLEDRARIARDLHDHVVQQLYGAGLDLQAVAATSEGPGISRIESAVAAIDDAIAQVRTIVFALTPRADGTPTLRHRVLDLAASASSRLPQPVSVAFSGPVDLVADGRLADELTASVRELLSNVVKHSGAASVQLSVLALDGTVTAVVIDDGHGIGVTARRSGLENLRVRAERLGGSFDVDTGPRGTHARWSVPSVPAPKE